MILKKGLDKKRYLSRTTRGTIVSRYFDVYVTPMDAAKVNINNMLSNSNGSYY